MSLKYNSTSIKWIMVRDLKESVDSGARDVIQNSVFSIPAPICILVDLDMAELIVVCMTSLGMTSCMTSVFRVTSPVTRSVVKASAQSIPGCERSRNCGFLGNQNDGGRPAGAGGAGGAGGVPRQPPGFGSSLSTELEGVE